MHFILQASKLKLVLLVFLTFLSGLVLSTRPANCLIFISDVDLHSEVEFLRKNPATVTGCFPSKIVGDACSYYQVHPTYVSLAKAHGESHLTS